MKDDTRPSAYFRRSAQARSTVKTANVSVRLSHELLQRLAEVGNEEGLALSDAIRVVLERGLVSGKKRQGVEK